MRCTAAVRWHVYVLLSITAVPRRASADLAI